VRKKGTSKRLFLKTCNKRTIHLTLQTAIGAVDLENQCTHLILFSSLFEWAGRGYLVRDFRSASLRGSPGQSTNTKMAELIDYPPSLATEMSQVRYLVDSKRAGARRSVLGALGRRNERPSMNLRLLKRA